MIEESMRFVKHNPFQSYKAHSSHVYLGSSLNKHAGELRNFVALILAT